MRYLELWEIFAKVRYSLEKRLGDLKKNMTLCKQKRHKNNTIKLLNKHSPTEKKNGVIKTNKGIEVVFPSNTHNLTTNSLLN